MLQKKLFNTFKLEIRCRRKTVIGDGQEFDVKNMQTVFYVDVH